MNLHIRKKAEQSNKGVSNQFHLHLSVFCQMFIWETSLKQCINSDFLWAQVSYEQTSKEEAHCSMIPLKGFVLFTALGGGWNHTPWKEIQDWDFSPLLSWYQEVLKINNSIQLKISPHKCQNTDGYITVLTTVPREKGSINSDQFSFYLTHVLPLIFFFLTLHSFSFTRSLSLSH